MQKAQVFVPAVYFFKNEDFTILVLYDLERSYTETI